jgi:VWFA-related protein
VTATPGSARRRLVAWCLVAGLAAPAAPAAHAQHAVPGSIAEVVELDVVVTDGDGRPIRNLTRADFEVQEDGKAQTLTLFVPSGSNAAPRSADATESEDDEDADSRPPSRSIAVVVDDLHIAPENIEMTRRALRRLPRELMGDDDSAALVSTARGVLQQFTKDSAVLGQAIERLIAQAPVVPTGRGTQMTPAQAELILKGDRGARKLAAKALIAEPGSVFDVGGPRAALAAPGNGSNGAFAGGGDAGLDAAAEDEAQRQARGVLVDSLRYSVASLSAVADVIRGLSARPGRKLCLLVSDGFLVGRGTSEERTRDLLRVTDAATRSGAVVYTLDTRGLLSGGIDASVAGSGVQQEFKAGIEAQSSQLFRTTLREIAADTGGFLVSGTNDMANGLARMLADNAAYYLMAYEPTNTKRDGKFRKIKVRLPQHSNYEVRTRAGYFARDAKNPLPPARAVLDPGLDLDQAREALAAPLPGGGIPVRLGADFLDLPSTGSQAMIRAHVELAGLAWEKAGERNHGTLELMGSAYDASGQPVGAPFGQRAELDFSDDELKRAVASGVEFQQPLSLAPGRYEVRLIARERRLGQVGGASEEIEIPDLADGKLAMSGVFLASAPSGAAAGVETRSTRRFKKGENLFFQVYVYNAREASPGKADVVLQAQIWSKGKAIAASKPQPAKLAMDGETPLPETNEVGLAGLDRGPYDLRVVVVDRKADATAFRTVDFVIE